MAFEKVMQRVSVTTNNDGDICVSQFHDLQGEDTIFVSPDQVDQLIQWLQEARAHLQSDTD